MKSHVEFSVALLTSVLLQTQLSAQDFTFVAEHTVGVGTANTHIEIVDPMETTGDRYRVTFSRQGDQFFYSVENLNTQTKLVDNLPTDTSSQPFDGIVVSVDIPPSQIKDLLEVRYGNTRVDPPGPIFRPGDREGEGGNNSTNEYTFVGAGGRGDFSRIIRSENNTAHFDYEIRFDGNPEGRNKFVHGFTAQGTIDVPFSVWNIGRGTPDDPSDDRQIIAIGFDDSQNPAAYDGGARPSDGGPGTMYDRIYIYEIERNAPPEADLNGDGAIDYDDFLQDLQNNGGDLSSVILGRPYTGFPMSEVLSRFSMVSLNGDPNYMPPVGTTIRIVTTKPLTAEDVYEFTVPDFGLFTSPISLNLGNVRLGAQFSLPLILINSSGDVVSIRNITSDSPDFQASQSRFSIAPGESTAVEIAFAPSDVGLVTNMLTISSNDAVIPEYRLSVSGEGLPITEGAINILGRFTITGGATDVWGFVDENTGKEYALVGAAGRGVSIVDVTEPARPHLASHVSGIPSFDVKAWRHYMYSVTGGPGQGQGIIVDIAHPENPQIVGSFDSSHNIFITKDGYMILEFPGFRVLDLNPDPTHPTLLFTGGTEGHDASVIDGVLYDFHGRAGTFIYDFSDPANPILISGITDPEIRYNHSGWISKDGHFLFICDELSNDPAPDIVVYDIHDLSNPQRVGEFRDSTATVHNLFVIGDVAVTSYYTAGFKALDISDPLNPTVLDAFDTAPESSGEGFGGAWGVYPFAPSGNVYVSDRTNGLYLFTVKGLLTSVGPSPGQRPEEFTLFKNYPNPFNPETTIRYEIPKNSRVELVIYNIRGQRIRTLVDTEKESGRHSIKWDGKNNRDLVVPSGVYFYRIKAEEFVQARQMLLLR